MLRRLQLTERATSDEFDLRTCEQQCLDEEERFLSLLIKTGVCHHGQVTWLCTLKMHMVQWYSNDEIWVFPGRHNGEFCHFVSTSIPGVTVDAHLGCATLDQGCTVPILCSGLSLWTSIFVPRSGSTIDVRGPRYP